MAVGVVACDCPKARDVACEPLAEKPPAAWIVMSDRLLQLFAAASVQKLWRVPGSVVERGLHVVSAAACDEPQYRSFPMGRLYVANVWCLVAQTPFQGVL